MSELWIFRCPDRFPDSELIVPHRMVQMQFIELGTRGTDSFPLFVHMLISIYRATQKLVLVCVSSKKRTNQIEKVVAFNSGAHINTHPAVSIFCLQPSTYTHFIVCGHHCKAQPCIMSSTYPSSTAVDTNNAQALSPAVTMTYRQTGTTWISKRILAQIHVHLHSKGKSYGSGFTPKSTIFADTLRHIDQWKGHFIMKEKLYYSECNTKDII